LSPLSIDSLGDMSSVAVEDSWIVLKETTVVVPVVESIEVDDERDEEDVVYDPSLEVDPSLELDRSSDVTVLDDDKAEAADELERDEEADVPDNSSRFF
jgi:hypothetical protein